METCEQLLKQRLEERSGREFDTFQGADAARDAGLRA